MTKMRIEPILGSLDSDVVVPGSKSLTNRALLVASLATGASTLSGFGAGDDVEAMVDCVAGFGATVALGANSEVVVTGCAGTPQRPSGALDARMSGTTARFVTPVLTLCGGSITGHAQMQGRPMGALTSALRDLHASIDNDALPLVIEPINLYVDARPKIAMPAHVSSQFISGILMLGPLLEHGLELELTGKRVSQSYIDMTLSVMRHFGATVIERAEGYLIESGGYSAREYSIEPDASAASYPLAAAAIVGGRVRVLGLGAKSVQGDSGFVDVLAEMGASVHVDESFIEVRGSGQLRGCSVDLGDLSDTAPTFAALGARAVGRSAATGIGFIRNTKESDRVAGAVAELHRLGVQAGIDPDGFHVYGGAHKHAQVETYEDHRMAMAFALLGLADEPVTILDSGCVAKTYPTYWELISQLRSEARIEPLILAIDGPAGAGKSTVARLVAQRLALPHLDTGAMYRSIAHLTVEEGLALHDTAAIVELASSATITLLDGATIVNGEDVTTDIRTSEVTAAVSAVAAVPEVREILVAQQQTWAANRGAGVLEGRDIGTAVFPNATLKIYLTASSRVRAERRAAEIQDPDLVAMIADIEQRDQIDSSRATDPLRQADDAVLVDSSSLTIDQVVDTIMTHWQHRRRGQR